MAIEFQDRLRAELVLAGVGLLNNQEETEAFTKAVLVDVNVTAPGPTVIPSTGEISRLIQIPRDRIALHLSPSRSILRRDYPLGPGDLDRLADVVILAIDNTLMEGQTLRAYGYNVEIVYSQDSGLTASLYLAERLFPHKLLVSEGRELIGGSGKIDLQDGRNRWGVRMEPRHNDLNEMRVFLSVNLHRDEHSLPDEADIRASLKDAWDQAHNFAQLLDERGK